MKTIDFEGLDNIYKHLNLIGEALIMHIDKARNVPFNNYNHLMDASSSITKAKESIGDYIEANVD